MDGMGDLGQRTLHLLVVIHLQLCGSSRSPPRQRASIAPPPPAGTIVYEGVLDGRPVAVKRLLRQFYDLARKEIQVRGAAVWGYMQC
jgi:hypothetical protein